MQPAAPSIPRRAARFIPALWMHRHQPGGSLSFRLMVLLGLLGTCWMTGCSRFPKPPKPPDLSPSEAAQKAISQYDANGDGKLSGDELKKCPALAVAMKRIDTNGDGALEADEIAARIKSWATCGTIMTGGTVAVTLDGKPLKGATVTFEPEAFLGPAFKTCKATTDSGGYAYVTGQDAKFPGIYLGFYRVRISKQAGGREILPARYNTQSELGYEAATDIGGIGTINFDLKSR
jgi:EF hand